MKMTKKLLTTMIVAFMAVAMIQFSENVEATASSLRFFMQPENVQGSTATI